MDLLDCLSHSEACLCLLQRDVVRVLGLPTIAEPDCDLLTIRLDLNLRKTALVFGCLKLCQTVRNGVLSSQG